MPDLSVRLKFIDDLSSRLERIANTGQEAVSRWEQMGNALNNVLGSTASFANRAVTSTNSVTSAMLDFSSSLSRVSSNTDDLSEDIETLTNTSGGLSEIAEILENDINNLSNGINGVSNNIGAMTNDVNNLTSNIDNFSDSIDNVSDNVDDLNNDVEELGDAEEDTGNRGSAALKTLSNALTSLGIVEGIKKIADSFTECAEKAEITETAFAKLQTIAGAGNIGNLSSDIMELSSSTGIAADSLADVAYNAISAGSAVNEAVSTSAAASKLAVAGFTDSASALNTLETALNSYGEAAGTAMDISDSLIMVQNLGVTTVAELSAQMGKAISTASAYNVSLGNLESAYISTTKSGIATAESTTYISSMLNELGKEGTVVSGILQEQTGKTFGQLMADGSSLADVLGILYTSVDNNAEAMMNLWGSAEAGKAANAIISRGLTEFNENLDAVTNSAGATEKAYATMADTTAFAHQKMQNSMNNLQVAIGNNLNPAFEKLYNVASTALNIAAKFATEHPVITKAVTATAVAVGALAIGITGFTFVTQTAIPALTAFGTAVWAATGPVGLIAAGVAAAAVGIGTFIAMCDDSTDEVSSLSSYWQEQHEKLTQLESSYKEACNTYGETSDEASALKYQIDELNNSYENNKETIDEYCERLQRQRDELEQLRQQHNDNMQTINDSEKANYALIARLTQLNSSTNKTAGTQKEMETIVAKLNDSVDGLNLSYSDLENNQDAVVNSLKEYAAEQARQEKYNEMLNRYIELTKSIPEQQQKVTDSNKVLDASYSNLIGNIEKGAAVWTILDSRSEYKKALEECNAETDLLNEQQEELAEIESEWENMSEAAEKAATEVNSYQEAVNVAYNSVKDNLTELAQSYDEAYEAAYSSLDGQFKLFDEVSMKSGEYANATVANAQTALDSQLAYWETYSSNIEQLKTMTAEELNLTQEQYDKFMSYVQSGSEEAAGLAQSMVENISSGNQTAVEKLAATYAKVEEQKQTVSDSIAKWKTDFDNKMDDIVKKMNETVDNMDLEGEAKEAAKKTIEGYANGIRISGGKAVAEAESVANRIKAALSNISAPSVNIQVPKVSTAAVQQNAAGTTNADDVFIAGEEGPELIVGKRGSTVFPKSETERIIEAVGGGWDITGNYGRDIENIFENHNHSAINNYVQKSDSVPVYPIDTANSDKEANKIIPPYEYAESDKENKTEESTRRIVLEIAGSGSVEVNGETSFESIWDKLQGNLKSVIKGIFKSEIYEEGELSYDF